MDVKVRNHLASLCFNFVKRNHPGDFKTLSELATENYQDGYPVYTIETIWRKFAELKRQELVTEVL